MNFTFVSDSVPVDGREGIDPSIFDKADKTDASSTDINSVSPLPIGQR